MQFSVYQIALFDYIQNEKGSVIIEAVAGSGKTTSIVEACRRLPENLSVLFLAFNTSIVNELRSRLPSGVACSTFNSCGWGAWRRFAGKKMIKVDANKTRGIIREKFSSNDQAIYGAFVNKMVALAKSSGLRFEDPNERWLDIIEHYSLTLEVDGDFDDDSEISVERAIDLSKKTLQLSCMRAKDVCDFDDQIYMPWLTAARFDQYDVVFIDEAQDTNGIQKDLLRRMLKPGGRLIAVGDPCQAIYGFRGADSESMNMLQQSFNAKKMPLSISYRCAQSVIRKAQEYVSHIEAFSGAPEGEVKELDKFSINNFGANDAILCRNTAPLVKMAYTIIARGRAINFLGRDILKGLKVLINNMKAKDVDDLSVKVQAWFERESEKNRAKNQEEKNASLEDKVQCVEIFIENLPESARTINDLMNAINALCEDKGRGITLATVHKSKGREWDRVFILDFDLMPSPYAKKDWMKVQENNLIYVAVTRAKHSLFFIKSNGWADA